MSAVSNAGQERGHVEFLPGFEIGPDHDRDFGVELHGRSSRRLDVMNSK